MLSISALFTCELLYLLLSGDSLLVSLPPGRVVDVEEGFISCRDASRSEQLQRNTTNTKVMFICGALLRPVDVLSDQFDLIEEYNESVSLETCTCSSAFLSRL